MAESQAAVAAAPTTAAEGQPMNGETIGAKRQRRPSVRLGDLGGDLPFDSHPHTVRTRKPQPSHSSKSRPLFNLTSDVPQQTLSQPDDPDRFDSLDSLAIGSWKTSKYSKKRGSKRVRSNWASKVADDSGGGEGDPEAGAEKYSGGEDFDDGYDDFDADNSEQSPVHSLEGHGHGNERDVHYRRRAISRGRSGDRHEGAVELSGPSDTDARDRRGRYGEDGVKIWLNGLGLGRYAPVFEIHEVDDEVLPMLTLEDLKDMGINAVGSRRKLYCAIQKLSKGFS